MDGRHARDPAARTEVYRAVTADGGERRRVARRVAASRRRVRRRRTVAAAMVVALVAVVIGGLVARPRGRSGSAGLPGVTGDLSQLSPMRRQIVTLAEGQLGYHSDPASSYCNKFSAYWYSGATDCPDGERDEEWCADFAAWAWKLAGAETTYQYVEGDLNSSAASFYEWGVRTGNWHPVGSGYVPQPGDVAVYGLDIARLYATHVAVVVGDAPSASGPNAVNGDGDRTGHSVVEEADDEYRSDASGSGSGSRLSGYVSPVTA